MGPDILGEASRHRRKRSSSFEKFREDFQKQLLADKDLSCATLRAGFALSHYINRETREAYPSLATLAKASGVSPRQVPRVIKTLEGRGHLDIIRRRKDSKQNFSNRYVLKLSGGSAIAVAVPSDTAMAEGSDTAMAPKPLTEPLPQPLNEPLSQRASADAAADIREEIFGRGTGKGSNRQDSEPASSALYRLAREHYPAISGGIVTNALRRFGEVETAYRIKECMATDGDLGVALTAERY